MRKSSDKEVSVKGTIRDGIYNLRWGIREIRLIVTSQIAEEKQNAVWLMFSKDFQLMKYSDHFPHRSDSGGLSTDEVFKAFSSEEIEAYLKKLQKKTTSKKKGRTAD